MRDRLTSAAHGKMVASPLAEPSPVAGGCLLAPAIPALPQILPGIPNTPVKHGRVVVGRRAAEG